MDWGGPEFVLAIIAIASFAGVMKAAVRAKYGVAQEEEEHRPRGRRGRRSREEIETLRAENARLIERVEAYEDRVVVLERIVTDSSYRLGQEIESLREDKGNVQ